MKLLTKHPDYYDPMVSVYGRDEQLFYDRRDAIKFQAPRFEWRGKDSDEISEYHDMSYISVAVGGTCYEIMYFRGSLVAGPEDIERITRMQMDRSRNNYPNLIMFGWGSNVIARMSSGKPIIEECRKAWDKRISPTDINAKKRIPVLAKWGHNRDNTDAWDHAIISDTGIAAILSADEAYQKVIAFLGWLKDNPAPPEPNDNDGKIVAAGFDVKDSFRPNKK